MINYLIDSENIGTKWISYLDENIEEKIISQTVNKRLETAPPDEVLNKDIEIITKEGKLYYLK